MLRVSGKDAYKFLQGLVTKDVYKLKDAMYGCFLNTKGRIVADATFIKDRIIEPNDETSILIHTHSSFVESIEKHIKKYRLRSKVDIAHANFAMSQYVSDIAPYQTEKFHCFPDPRHVTFGFNVVQASDAANEDVSLPHAKLGIATGPLIVDKIPVECNIDLLNGIDFAKGCYLGQELTARTQFKGKVRKRILPINVPSEVSLDDKLYTLKDNQPAGRLLSPNLAMLRLEALNVPLKSLGDQSFQCNAPAWWPELHEGKKLL